MFCENEMTLQQNTAGAELRINTPGLDLANVDAFQIRLEKPSGAVRNYDFPTTGPEQTAKTLPTELFGETIAGYVSWIVQPNDFGEIGPVRIQVIDTTSGRNVPTEAVALLVLPSL